MLTIKEVSKARQAIATLWLFLGIMFIPSVAFANPIADGVDWLLDLLTNGVPGSVAIIAIVVLGYMAWAGRLTGEAAVKFIGGIVLVFGGAAIVDLIIAAVS
ncbi:TrbC/VirB2 family protein [Aeromonas veronii]|uniref:TrbC/VirB2 family protein n=1 Tax=Aeromonas veronii TaxID=654 RepID=UPI002441D806|nr:TrbC/VirB2 family protein [Aeromonas veronii]